MILIACTTCGLTLRVEGSVQDENRKLDFLVGKGSIYWPDKYLCIECGQPAVSLDPSQISDRANVQLRVVDVTPQEAFCALEGLGLPAERSCRLDDVTELMRTHGVKAVSGKDLRGTGRCIIDHLELGDGSKVYLASSSEGATVYRITRAHSYVEGVSLG